MAGAKHVYDTLIVGTGFTGIGTAIKLTQSGVDDFVMLERHERVGGTWRDNTYPGAACDIPSLLYSFSFVANPTWSRAYSPADEIRRHIEDMVDRFDLRRRIQFGTEVNGLSFDEDEGVWTVSTTGRKEVPRPHRRVGLGPAARSRVAGRPRDRHLRGQEDPQCQLGPRLRLHRKAGGGHRHRRQRRADRARVGQAGRVRQGLSAHARLGDPAIGRRHPGTRAGVVREGACRTTTCQAGPVLGPRSECGGAGMEDSDEPRSSRGSGRPTCAGRSRIRGCAGS